MWRPLPTPTKGCSLQLSPDPMPREQLSGRCFELPGVAINPRKKPEQKAEREQPSQCSSEASSPSLTHIDPLGDFTLITQHVTTPVETTVAALRSRLPEHIVPTATAQAAATIQQAAGLVASPASRARGAQGGVSLAEVRRLLIVNQLS